MSGQRHSAQSGFTLIETLVALVVISVGMLGIAALYVESLKAGRSSIARTTAVNLAADMADRIRANPRAVAAYGAGAANNNCVGGAVDCTPVLLAQDDLWWWNRDIVTRLPGGAGNIIVAAAGPLNVYTITLSWTEAGVAVPQTYVLTLQA
jgi:type IV pilus assembly protein PilV